MLYVKAIDCIPGDVPGSYLYPVNATEISPLTDEPGKYVWANNQWVVLTELREKIKTLFLLCKDKLNAFATNGANPDNVYFTSITDARSAVFSEENYILGRVANYCYDITVHKAKELYPKLKTCELNPLEIFEQLPDIGWDIEVPADYEVSSEHAPNPFPGALEYFNEYMALNTKYYAPWDGTTAGILIFNNMAREAAVASPREEKQANLPAIQAQREKIYDNVQAEFQALDIKYGLNEIPKTLSDYYCPICGKAMWLRNIYTVNTVYCDLCGNQSSLKKFVKE
jgi:predicted RNA-binding Zn-ribbon protein involved in translation (DUF1610 family)